MQAACVGTFTSSGVLTDREWTNLYQNFDNVGKGILTLFVAVTLNGYSREHPTLDHYLAIHDALWQCWSTMLYFGNCFWFFFGCKLIIVRSIEGRAS